MIYIALFRGINVGGKHSVKMDELKKLFSDQGFSRAKSYIQSGNVVFEAGSDPLEIKEQLSRAFQEKFGFPCAILIRSLDDMGAVIENLPFTERQIQAAQEADPEAEHLYAYFTDDPAAPHKLAELQDSYSGPDLAGSGEGVIYFLSEGSIRLSGLAVKLSKTMGDPTARNWNTVNKIYELMKSLES